MSTPHTSPTPHSLEPMAPVAPILITKPFVPSSNDLRGMVDAAMARCDADVARTRQVRHVRPAAAANTAYLGTAGWQAFKAFRQQLQAGTQIWSAEHKRRLAALDRRATRKDITSDWTAIVGQLLDLQDQALGITPPAAPAPDIPPAA